ncbi:SGNH/GDSL hydrolase family protein [Actinophytocola gossypii]|uniref:SGNH/GDSL hydrolase family protein n=1 Tax=Actinophytocola gossypii TaxID=2812003 RepID=A0ABT2JCM1_9PSEU|nr:SGNH/GDSL hydrolase family protein [Actinophytocola gossypii]MCT2585617.1 SGNH/GDSL hydrolase family protein [Actinophytocola gossypii]
MAWVRVLKALMLGAGSVGGLSGAAYGLLNGQSKRARTIIGKTVALPLNADGVYLPDGSGPVADEPADPLSFAVLGDSLAAGLGAETVGRLPGVILAKGLAEESGRPVRLATHAVGGSRTSDLEVQVDVALIQPPDLVLVIVGGNDVTSRMRVGTSAEVLADQVARLRRAGTTVVVGTCPDLDIVQPIPQPLRTIASRWGLALARAQRRRLEQQGVRTVSLAALVSPEFRQRPDELFSDDRFHPNGAGYELAASVMLAPLCDAAGLLGGRELTGA